MKIIIDAKSILKLIGIILLIEVIIAAIIGIIILIMY